MRHKWTKEEKDLILKTINESKGFHLYTDKFEYLMKTFKVSKSSLSNEISKLRRTNNIKGYYTKKDVKVIKDCVSKYPYNLSKALEEAASMINGTKYGVENYYYKKLRKQKHSMLFAMIGKGSYAKNTKNIWRTKMTSSIVTNTNALKWLHDKLIKYKLLPYGS